MINMSVQNVSKPLRKVILGALSAVLLTACVQTQEVASGSATANAATQLANPLDRSSNRKLLEAMDICLADFPNLLQVRTRLRQSGYQSEGRFGNKEIFTAYNRNIIVVVSASATDRLCSFGLDGLRDQEAVLLAGALFGARANGTLELGSPQDPRFLAAYRFDAPNGVKVIGAVGRQVTISGLYRGSIIYLIEAEE